MVPSQADAAFQTMEYAEDTKSVQGLCGEILLRYLRGLWGSIQTDLRKKRPTVAPTTKAQNVVAFVTPTRPVSANNSPKRRFTQAIVASARTAWTGPFLSAPLYARIVWFHRYPADRDVDNIAKRLLDSLKGVLYQDDSAISHCLTIGVDATGDVQLDGSAIGVNLFTDLETLVADTVNRDVLYVEIGEHNPTTVKFGPVE